MGIPGLFLHYFRKFKKQDELLISLDVLKKSNIKYLFFDYNSLIHPCAQQILSANYDRYIEMVDPIEQMNQIENDIIENCLNYSQFIIDILNVKDIYIVIDGVAPRSKMNQQRERRYKSHFFKDMEESTGKSKLWDSNKITPGTHFMDKMTNLLKDWIKKNSKSDYSRECPMNIILSDSNDCGEGEHKMMKIISESKFDTLNGNICIYGLDADLIMLSMINKRSDNIVLIRDNSFQQKDAGISYLNIKLLKQYIIKDIIFKFDGTGIGGKSNYNNENLLVDYILLCFFLGNDFLDHLFTLNIKENGIDVILKAYIKANKGHYLINLESLKNKDTWKTCINLVYLRDIFYQLKNYEDHYLNNKIHSKSTFCKIDIKKVEEVNLNTESKIYFYKDLYSNKSTVKSNPSLIKKQYCNFYNLSDLNSICFNYIEGLYWILGYYNGHVHNNWSWYYKYHNAPLCEDIFNYLKRNNNKLINDINQSKHLNSSESYSCLKQLCLVLPRESLVNLKDHRFDEVIKHFDNSNSSKYITNLFPIKLYVDIIGKEYLWQSKILFERINEEILDILV